MQRLTGKRAIITGGGSGIGRASALRFASEGAQVMVVGRREANIAETVDMVRKAGGTAIAFAADAAVEANVEAMIARCVAEFGGLEVFFANAFVAYGTPLFETTVAQWQEVLRVNLIGSFLAVKYAGAYMRDQGRGGSIIMTSSAASLRSNAGDTAYSASKAGVNSLAMLAANALDGSNVRVNAILPGLIETDATKAFFDAVRRRGVEHKVGVDVNPLRRAGQPQEIAAVAAFLASDDASYIDGQCISVDGGVSSRHPGKF